MFSEYLKFCHDFFLYVGKRLDKKVKVNFKICNATNWETHDCNT